MSEGEYTNLTEDGGVKKKFFKKEMENKRKKI